MAIEIRVPALGESISEATVGKWFKKAGEPVQADEPLVELETDKVTLEVNAPSSGVLSEIAAETGQTVAIGALLGQLSAGAATPAATSVPAAAAKAAPAPAAATPMPPAPAAAKLAAEDKIDLASVAGSGKRGQVLKGDVLAAVASARAPSPVVAPAPLQAPALAPIPASAPAPMPAARTIAPDDSAREERVRMTKLRQTIARRLKDAQNTAAMLTTFNEVDMSEVMALRARYKDAFEKKHGAKLGFMGFFVKACVQALKEVPAVNAEIDGADLVYKNYYHIGIAVGTDKGLIVPVVRDADRLSIAEIEKAIADLGKRARDGQLKLEELRGGTFTVTNG
ncbi:MAG TPA: 2-oxo acid dehydrogenase subunit E2, partial [Roseiarcus sp.]